MYLMPQFLPYQEPIRLLAILCFNQPKNVKGAKELYSDFHLILETKLIKKQTLFKLGPLNSLPSWRIPGQRNTFFTRMTFNLVPVSSSLSRPWKRGRRYLRKSRVLPPLFNRRHKTVIVGRS